MLSSHAAGVLERGQTVMPLNADKHAASVTRSLSEDIFASTGLTPSIQHGMLTVCDNAHGQYLISDRNSGIPAGTSLMLVHDQTQAGGETTLLMDTDNLAGTLHSMAQTSAAVCWHILNRQAVIMGLEPWACN